MIFFTADTHFNHANIIKYCNRPFQDVNEMNTEIVERWNKIVKENDLIYHLGDFAWSNSLYFIKQLNGHIHIIFGNHDKDARKYKSSFQRYSDFGFELKEKDHHIVLCHYAMKVWNRSHFNSWHLYGHSHGTLTTNGKSYDVGVDSNNFKPVSLDEICDIMKDKSSNINYIEKNGR